MSSDTLYTSPLAKHSLIFYIDTLRDNDIRT